jgi:formylglycine-generating enzyme required for sulfatase activity
MKIGEQQVNLTTPVGIYPTGVSPFGVYDGVGNVWEWCATKWIKPYPYNVQENEWTDEYLGGTAGRMLRGGSWVNDNADIARCAARNWNFRIKYEGLGCRVAAISAI